MPTPQARRYCWTLNNPTDAEQNYIRNHCNSFVYIVFGREVSSTGTPHLQGFFHSHDPISIHRAKILLGTQRVHLERARGTSLQASDYCKKDGDFDEFGVLASEQGKRTDWDRYKEYVVELGRVPNKREMVAHNTSLYARYSAAMVEIAKLILPAASFTDSTPRLGFQTRVCARIDAEPFNARTVDFVVDADGNSGKSWICQYAITKYPERVQVLSVGKRDDMAYAIDENKDIFLFDVPRNQMTYFQYSVVEMLKNRMIFSNKYQSCMKKLTSVPYVAVFSNEMPQMDAMSEDRYNIIEVTEENRGH